MYGLCVALQLTITCIFELPVWYAPSERPVVTAQILTEDREVFNRKLQQQKQTGATTIPNDVWMCNVDGDICRKRVSIHSFDQCGTNISQWYSNALFEQGTFVILVALEVLGDSLPAIPLSMQIPDVYRFVTSPGLQSTAEVTAGLIPTNIDSVGTAHAAYTDHRHCQTIDHHGVPHHALLHLHRD